MKPFDAVAQMNSVDDIESNFQAVEHLCKDAKARGASLVCFPENFAFMPRRPSDALQMAETLDGKLFSRYRAIAHALNLEISYGGFQEKASSDRFYNTHVIVNASGEVKAAYRKIHLFAADLPDGTRSNEADTCEPGSEVTTAEASVGTLGLSICYDLRFPELFNALRVQGAQLLLIPAAFTSTTGKAHWEVLLRARAIENQCYVIAAAQYGNHHQTRTTHGHAMVVDPWGSIVAQRSNSQG